jgi:hypothetical protein
MQNKKSWHYWIIFIFLLFIFSYINYALANEFYIWSAAIGILTNVLIFLVVIIPFTAYLSNRIVTFIQSKNMQKRSAFRFILVAMILLPIAVVALTIYDEYREKSLLNVIGDKSSDVELLEFHLDGSEYWQSENEEAIEELFDFLGQYNVKKISNHDWDSDVSKELSFRFTVFTENDINIVSIHENRLSILSRNNSGYYSIMDEPVNLEWITSFNEKYD